MTGETLVLNKTFPSTKQGFSQYQAGKVGKKGLFEQKAINEEVKKYYTVNVTGETLVLNKKFPNINQGFAQQ